MPKRHNEFELTIVYTQAEHGWLTASVPALPGTISTGPTRDGARANVLDAVRTMLSTPPERTPEAGQVERLRLRLEVAKDIGRSVER